MFAVAVLAVSALVGAQAASIAIPAAAVPGMSMAHQRAALAFPGALAAMLGDEAIIAAPKVHAGFGAPAATLVKYALPAESVAAAVEAAGVPAAAYAKYALPAESSGETVAIDAASPATLVKYALPAESVAAAMEAATAGVPAAAYAKYALPVESSVAIDAASPAAYAKHAFAAESEAAAADIAAAFGAPATITKYAIPAEGSLAAGFEAGAPATYAKYVLAAPKSSLAAGFEAGAPATYAKYVLAAPKSSLAAGFEAGAPATYAKYVLAAPKSSLATISDFAAVPKAFRVASPVFSKFALTPATKVVAPHMAAFEGAAAGPSWKYALPAEGTVVAVHKPRHAAAAPAIFKKYALVGAPESGLAGVSEVAVPKFASPAAARLAIVSEDATPAAIAAPAFGGIAPARAFTTISPAAWGPFATAA